MNGRRTRVKEEEIVDVLLGKADPEVEERVKRIVTTDEVNGRAYARWDGTVDQARDFAAPVQEVVQRVTRNVLERIHASSGKPLTTLEAPLEGWWERSTTWIFGGPNRSAVRSFAPVAALLAVTVVCLGGSMFWSHVQALHTISVAHAEGSVHAVRGGDAEGAVLLRSGDRLRIPVQLRLSAGAEINVGLAGGSTLNSVTAPSNIEFLAPRHVRQDSGTVVYSLTHDASRVFTVDVPQGKIIDLGTAFEVEVAHDRPTVVRVTSGRVRLEPRFGDAITLEEGQRATLSESQAATSQAMSPTPVGAPKGPAEAHHPPYRPREEVMSASLAPSCCHAARTCLHTALSK